MEFRTAQKDIRSLLSGDKIPGDKFEQLTISIIGGAYFLNLDKKVAVFRPSDRI